MQTIIEKDRFFGGTTIYKIDSQHRKQGLEIQKGGPIIKGNVRFYRNGKMEGIVVTRLFDRIIVSTHHNNEFLLNECYQNGKLTSCIPLPQFKIPSSL